MNPNHYHLLLESDPEILAEIEAERADQWRDQAIDREAEAAARAPSN